MKTPKQVLTYCIATILRFRRLLTVLQDLPSQDIGASSRNILFCFMAFQEMIEIQVQGS